MIERRRSAGPIRCLPRRDEEIEPPHDLIYVFNHPGDTVDIKAIAVRTPEAEFEVGRWHVVNLYVKRSTWKRDHVITGPLDDGLSERLAVPQFERRTWPRHEQRPGIPSRKYWLLALNAQTSDSRQAKLAVLRGVVELVQAHQQERS
jgi:hypothetical protein